VLLRRVDDPAEDGEGTARMVVTAFRKGDERHPVDALRGKKTFVFSGLADNEQFRRTVAGLGCEIVGWSAFEDHHLYTKEDVDRVCEEADRLGALPLTSEKDAVKVDVPRIAVLEASMRIPSLESIVERISALVRK